ncbi:MAG: hypothetical protein PHO07_08510 [Pirellulales bacterium]|jgi:hypothetical protein|nr:hypothetical protein [Thermoguttaceae bacterium]MDD4787199.1 hypothetical protein [Pirellulales bacterium]MDI9446559.1 hypothetical protein [Planctomycetota bacterium]NLZ00888.1 hypothetical protein [Pirellulaceae bacterium]
MVERTQESHEARFPPPSEGEILEYRPLCGLAVAGLILGLFSWLAILHIGFAVVGAAAILAALASMIRIARAPGMIGRGLAVAGCVLAIFWTAAAWAKDLTHARLMDSQSREFALLWFEFLRDNEPAKAMELGNHPASRQPFNAALIDHYLVDRDRYESLQGFVANPEVRALLRLGDRAQVRFYKAENHDEDWVGLVFAVTYQEEAVPKAFFVRLILRRVILAEKRVSAWYLESSRGPLEPETL